MKIGDTIYCTLFSKALAVSLLYQTHFRISQQNDSNMDRYLPLVR
jgi:hypothetical protein